MAALPRSVRTARDDARARALGYRNYYDYRIHDYGRVRPGEAVPSGQRARLRGHGGLRDLERSLKPGDTIVLPDGLASVSRDGKGRYGPLRVLVLKDNGRTQRFTIRRISYDRASTMLERGAKAGAVFSPTPSLDLRRLVRTVDRP